MERTMTLRHLDRQLRPLAGLFGGGDRPAFIVHQPVALTVPLVFSSPHSGRYYSPSFIESSRLAPERLRRSEDAYVEELFAGVTAHGAPLIAAQYPRAYLDLNREPYELDPELFREALPDYANTQSVRVVGGLGTIARVVAEAEEIYREPLTLEAGLVRIEALYKPFHAALAGLLEKTRQRFGLAVLIDCHSMPSATLIGGAQSTPRPDFVLGDRFGASCESRLTRFLREALGKLGYEVALNRPYAGGFITEHYGRPGLGVQAIQIEINRALYLNEEKFEKTRDFARLQRDLRGVMECLAREYPYVAKPRAAAAE